MLIYLLMVLNVVNGSMNVGTVLFKEIDATRTCWTREEISLLNTRRILQDLIPEEILNAETEEFIPAMLEYFETCAEAVEAVSQGKAQYFMLLALADSFGGWLHVYALPYAKEQYYAGTVKYEYMLNLYKLYDELKRLLKTNGTGWKDPKVVYANEVHPVKVEPAGTIADPCSALIVYEKPKSRDDKRNSNSKDYEVVIPMPILDDQQNPNAIALPFPKNGLRSLTVASSAYLLEKYYLASMKCLMSSGSDTEDFNQELYSWIVSEVIPHLHDSKWYPAFGGVLRIVTAMRNQGALVCRNPDNLAQHLLKTYGTHLKLPSLVTGIHKIAPHDKMFKPNDESLIPYHSRHRPMGHLLYEGPEKKASNVGDGSSKSQLVRWIILGLIVTFLILTIVCLCHCCCKRLRKTSDNDKTYQKLGIRKSRSKERKKSTQLSTSESNQPKGYLYETDTSIPSGSSSEVEEFVSNPERIGRELNAEIVKSMRGAGAGEVEPWSTENVNMHKDPSMTDMTASGQKSAILTSETTMTDASSDDMNTVDITTPKKNLSA